MAAYCAEIIAYWPSRVLQVGPPRARQDPEMRRKEGHTSDLPVREPHRWFVPSALETLCERKPRAVLGCECWLRVARAERIFQPQVVPALMFISFLFTPLLKSLAPLCMSKQVHAFEHALWPPLLHDL